MTKAALSNSRWTRGEHPFICAGEGIDDFVSFTMKYPCTFADVIGEIAQKRKLRVESLPREWESINIPALLYSEWHGPRLDEQGGGMLPVHGSASEKVKTLCGIVGNVEYKIVGRALRFRGIEVHGALSAFDELAGRLTYDAPRGSNGRIADEDYLRIVAELDGAGYRPIDYLEGECRKRLAGWNRQHSKDGKGRHTFSDAYNDSQFRDGVRKRLQRAQDKYKKAHRIA
jgi:hypothetical protein